MAERPGTKHSNKPEIISVIPLINTDKEIRPIMTLTMFRKASPMPLRIIVVISEIAEK